jgi:hypothetical protein
VHRIVALIKDDAWLQTHFAGDEMQAIEHLAAQMNLDVTGMFFPPVSLPLICEEVPNLQDWEDAGLDMSTLEWIARNRETRREEEARQAAEQERIEYLQELYRTYLVDQVLPTILWLVEDGGGTLNRYGIHGPLSFLIDHDMIAARWRIDKRYRGQPLPQDLFPLESRVCRLIVDDALRELRTAGLIATQDRGRESRIRLISRPPAELQNQASAIARTEAEIRTRIMAWLADRKWHTWGEIAEEVGRLNGDNWTLFTSMILYRMRRWLVNGPFERRGNEDFVGPDIRLGVRTRNTQDADRERVTQPLSPADDAVYRRIRLDIEGRSDDPGAGMDTR